MLADVVAWNFVPDVISTLFCYICVANGRPLWQMYMATCVEQVAGVVAKCGRWKSHMRVVYFVLS